MSVKTAITIRSFGAIKHLTDSISETDSIVYSNDAGRRLNESELCEILKNTDAVIAGTEPFTRKVFESAPDLRVISRVGVGLDNVDMDAARDHGVVVMNTPDAPTLAVAEHTLSLLLAVLKRIAQYNENMRKSNFSIEPGMLLSGKKAGIVGLGRIGHRVAEILEMLGCSVFYFDPFLLEPTSMQWIRTNTLEELLETVDIVTLHIPSQNEKPLLDKEAFKLCKPSMVLINTARGSLIDENALVLALEQGIVWGAGLDVFSTEPYTGKLLNYSQVVITPHVASNTVESRHQMEIEAINNMINQLRNE